MWQVGTVGIARHLKTLRRGRQTCGVDLKVQQGLVRAVCFFMPWQWSTVFFAGSGLCLPTFASAMPIHFSGLLWPHCDLQSTMVYWVYWIQNNVQRLEGLQGVSKMHTVRNKIRGGKRCAKHSTIWFIFAQFVTCCSQKYGDTSRIFKRISCVNSQPLSYRYCLSNRTSNPHPSPL